VISNPRDIEAEVSATAELKRFGLTPAVGPAKLGCLCGRDMLDAVNGRTVGRQGMKLARARSALPELLA